METIFPAGSSFIVFFNIFRAKADPLASGPIPSLQFFSSIPQSQVYFSDILNFHVLVSVFISQ